MKTRTGLLQWMVRRARTVTLVSLAVAVLFLLYWPRPLTPRSGWPALFVFVHSLFLTGTLGGARGGTHAFLYSRGFTRDAIWWHLMAATALCVLAVWLPASLTVWSGLRGHWQGTIMANPWFPVMVPAEMAVPWLWLALYAVVIPVFHYGWIRAAQPTRDLGAGMFLMAALVFCVLMLFMGFPTPWFRWVVCGGGVGVVLAALIGGKRLHRRMEVQV